MGPLIAVAGQPVPAGKVRSWREDSVALPATYVRALHQAGGQEAILAPRELSRDEAERLLERFDGLLLIGGGDIDPKHYGQDPLPECYGIDTEADVFEMRLVQAAVGRGMPVLAICRGFQILNVATGGSLDQHITGRDGLIGHGVPGVSPEMHEVRLEPGTWTAKAMGTETVQVSSSHHQAAARIGDGLVVSGRAPDGIVEAMEHPDGSWVVAVQWHPERTAEKDPAQQGLFDALVDQASR
ncbi:MAG TPA: gamma-glutamyl-gamma-aminobutyrate hydrolase family protein [Actinomycetota bacterium]|nr:gamma-glutamyl-gamma-aminobutyrate hydrolase family protein [Actinomycetota bacterium]